MMSQAPGDDLISTATTSWSKAPEKSLSGECLETLKTHSRGHFFLKSPERGITLVQSHTHSQHTHTHTHTLSHARTHAHYHTHTHTHAHTPRTHAHTHAQHTTHTHAHTHTHTQAHTHTHSRTHHTHTHTHSRTHSLTHSNSLSHTHTHPHTHHTQTHTHSLSRSLSLSLTHTHTHSHSHTHTHTDYKSITFSRLKNTRLHSKSLSLFQHRASLTSEDLEQTGFLFLAPAHFLCEHLAVLHRGKKVIRLQNEIKTISNIIPRQHIESSLNEESFRRK